ncbi:MAG: JDVT-CTERM system CAAX-type protease [Gammaproteobacteria bacterium]|nr:MAG: JDVT-CTERM system CAAX-type protease [Gammaproteobacteria bacterium]
MPWQDLLFWLALAAGPVCWLALYLLLQPELQPAWPLASPLAYLLPVLLYPVLEEIVFRGLIQELVHDYLSARVFGPLSAANLITSVLFAGMHLFTQPPLWAALVFFPSLVFGFFKDRYQSLTTPILLHVFYNAGYLWLFAVPA